MHQNGTNYSRDLRYWHIRRGSSIIFFSLRFQFHSNGECEHGRETNSIREQTTSNSVNKFEEMWITLVCQRQIKLCVHVEMEANFFANMQYVYMQSVSQSSLIDIFIIIFVLLHGCNLASWNEKCIHFAWVFSLFGRIELTFAHALGFEGFISGFQPEEKPFLHFSLFSEWNKTKRNERKTTTRISLAIKTINKQKKTKRSKENNNKISFLYAEVN